MELTGPRVLGLVRRAGRRRVQRLPRCVERRPRSGSTAATARSATSSSTSRSRTSPPSSSRTSHPDHCVDIYGLHVCCATASSARTCPSSRPRGSRSPARRSSADWGNTFDWQRDRRRRRARRVGDVDLRFSRTDHPPPTYAVEATRRRPPARSTPPTPGPDWSVGAFAPGADLVLSEATYLARRHARADPPLGASRPVRRRARRRAQRLMLTHLWPRLDPQSRSSRRARRRSAASVTLAAPHLVTTI